MIEKKQFLNKLFAFILMLFSASLGGFFMILFYKYHFTSGTFILVLPDWFLLLNIVNSIIGMYLGLQVLRNKYKLMPALIISLLLFLGLGIILYYRMVAV